MSAIPSKQIDEIFDNDNTIYISSVPMRMSSKMPGSASPLSTKQIIELIDEYMSTSLSSDSLPKGLFTKIKSAPQSYASLSKSDCLEVSNKIFESTISVNSSKNTGPGVVDSSQHVCSELFCLDLLWERIDWLQERETHSSRSTSSLASSFPTPPTPSRGLNPTAQDFQPTPVISQPSSPYSPWYNGFMGSSNFPPAVNTFYPPMQSYPNLHPYASPGNQGFGWDGAYIPSPPVAQYQNGGVSYVREPKTAPSSKSPVSNGLHSGRKCRRESCGIECCPTVSKTGGPTASSGSKQVDDDKVEDPSNDATTNDGRKWKGKAVDRSYFVD